jgi:WD40 repeat protein
MNSDGTDQRRLTFNEFEDSSPDRSPDGSQIAFISDRDDPRAGKCFPDCIYQIYVINADGSGERKLLDTEFRALHPDWHPDGTRLSFDTEFNLKGDIYVVNTDGSGLQRLIEDGFWADWSPDGTQLVFASKRDGNVELYVADAGGNNQRRLTDNSQLDYFPAWSPDGRRIAFARQEKRQIYVMNADGSNERQLTHLTNAENPSWSPDGTQIAFQSSGEGNFEIYAIDVEDALKASGGSAPRRLTDNRGADLWPSWGPAPGSGLYLGQTPPGLEVELFAPGIVSIEEGKEYKIAFSPDLREIYFTRRTPGGTDDRLWHSRLENGKLTVPEPAPFAYDALETDACFTPDGNRLYFNSARPLPGEEAASRLPNVWFVARTEAGWSEPQFAGPPLNDYQPVYFSFADDGTLYFTRSSPRGIYYAEPGEGQYREAHRLPDEINDVREVAHPAVAPDESYLAVDSAYEQGGRLVGSLYVSFNRPDGSWTTAVSLHDALKASEADVYAIPRITPDGKYLFFEKYDRETDRSDIYWVSTDVIEKLRPTTSSTPGTTDLTMACPPASGAGTVDPAISIYSVTLVVNGLEQVVRGGDTVQALAGDQVQVREVTICTGPFPGSGGEACVDFAPVSQSGQELATEHAGTHMVGVTPGLTTISGPDHVWTVDESWMGLAAVLNHWPPAGTKDLDCGDGRCERDDRITVGLSERLPITPATAARVENLQTFQEQGASSADLVFLPDGKHLASLGSNATYHLWDVESGQEVRRQSTGGGPVYYAAFSADGSRLAAEGPGHSIQVWDVASGQVVHTLRGHYGAVMSLAFSADGALLATADSNGLVEVWEVGPGRELYSLRGHSSPIGALAFSADGSRLASGSVEGSTVIKLWDMTSGEEVCTLAGHTDNVYSVAFSPNGRRLVSASGDGTVRMWDVASGRELRVLRGGRERIYSVAYSPDGTLLASGDFRGTIRFWDAESGAEVHSLQAHSDLLEPLVFSADGSLLASGSFDRTVKVWGVEK